jgi:hypothetical protein
MVTSATISAVWSGTSASDSVLEEIEIMISDRGFDLRSTFLEEIEIMISHGGFDLRSTFLQRTNRIKGLYSKPKPRDRQPSSRGKGLYSKPKPRDRQPSPRGNSSLRIIVLKSINVNAPVHSISWYGKSGMPPVYDYMPS